MTKNFKKLPFFSTVMQFLYTLLKCNLPKREYFNGPHSTPEIKHVLILVSFHYKNDFNKPFGLCRIINCSSQARSRGLGLIKCDQNEKVLILCQQVYNIASKEANLKTKIIFSVHFKGILMSSMEVSFEKRWVHTFSARRLSPQFSCDHIQNGG